MGDGSRCAGDFPLARGGFDRPSTPVSACVRRESWAGRLSALLQWVRLPLDSHLHDWEMGVVGRVTLHSLAAGPIAPRLSAPSRQVRSTPQCPSPRGGDGSRWASDSPLPRGGSNRLSTLRSLA